MFTQETHSTAAPRKATRPKPASAAGRRRQTPELLATDRASISFNGLPEGVGSFRALAATVAKALLIMGVSKGAVALARALAEHSQARDWQAGTRPLVWPKNATLEAQLVIGERCLQRYVLELREAGALVMADSANYRRYGRRDALGNIVLAETHGFDLSPWATCYADFATIVRYHGEDSAAVADAARLSRRCKRYIRQIVETAEAAGHDAEACAAILARAEAIWREVDSARSTLALFNRIIDREAHAAAMGRLTSAAHRMELLRQEAISTLAQASGRDARARIDGLGTTPGKTQDNSMEGTVKESGQPDNSVGHYNTTRTPPYSEDVQASHGDVVGAGSGSQEGAFEVEAATGSEPWQGRAPWDGGELRLAEVRTSPAELAALAPSLAAHVPQAGPVSWGSLSEACAAYAHAAGISQPLYKRAFRQLGWQSSMIALAIVASKDGGHFDISRGAYFSGMVKKAQIGQLDLNSSLFGLRAQKPEIAALHKPAKHRPPPAPRAAAMATAPSTRAGAPPAPAPEFESEADELAHERRLRRRLPYDGPAEASLFEALKTAREIPKEMRVAAAQAARAARSVVAEAAPLPDERSLQEVKLEIANKTLKAFEYAQAAKARLVALREWSPAWIDEKGRIREEIVEKFGVQYLPRWLQR